jgi:hypothetical protein
LRKGVEIIPITSGIAKEVKINPTIKKVKDIVFATIEEKKRN